VVLREPTTEDIKRLGERLHLQLGSQEIEAFRSLITERLEACEAVRDLARPPTSGHSRKQDLGHRISEDDPHNAWITGCKIGGEGTGPMSDWTVAVKDNIAVGGIEMTCGSQVLEGYVPNFDATVVSRLLEAGATVVGKTNLDDMAFSGSGDSSAFGPMLNPNDNGHLAGGSSGGSAIVVATGEVDLALGGDQGGSIRAPASWCGVVGHKPTHGLVPYTGAVGIEPTIDHVGPMTADVETAAKALTVMAGHDPADPRQPRSVPTERYETSLTEDPSDLSIAVLEEGFTRPGADPSVNEDVRATLDTLADGGATVEEVSVPIHESAPDIYWSTIPEGFLATIQGEGLGRNWNGRYQVGLAETLGKSRRARGGDLPPTVKLVLLFGAYTSQQYHSKYYAEGMNLREKLRERYDDILREYDVLAMPTTPMRAHEHRPDSDRLERIEGSVSNLANTCAFNMSGHPALSVPAVSSSELPAGVMFVGSHFDDATVLRAGYAAESA